MHGVVVHVVVPVVIGMHVFGRKHRMVMMLVVRMHGKAGQVRHSGSNHFLDRWTVRTGSWFRGVRERQSSRVNDAVVSDEGHLDLSGLSNPLPAISDLRDVRHDTEQTLLTSKHGLGHHVSQPDFEVGREVLARQFQHRDITTTIQLQGMDDGDGSDWTGGRSESLVKAVLSLIRGNDGPRGAVINHLLIRFLGTGSCLELDDPLL